MALQLLFLDFVSFICLIKVKFMYSLLGSQIHKVSHFIFKESDNSSKSMFYPPSLVFELCFEHVLQLIEI